MPTRKKTSLTSDSGNSQEKKRDIFGRDLSYLQSCYNDLSLVKDIDVYSFELESGYTPMHVLLARGFLQMAFQKYTQWKSDTEYISPHKFNKHILNQRDRESLTPLDLYYLNLSNSVQEKIPSFLSYGLPASSSIPNDLSFINYDETNNVPFKIKSNFLRYTNNDITQDLEIINGGSHILTLGSNIHHHLGTGNKDDRQEFFQLQIDQLHHIIFPPTENTFTHIRMNKYHSTLVTKDNEIFVCGNGTRGRLGNGSTDKPLFSFTNILHIQDNNISNNNSENLGNLIKEISTSDHHTLLLCSNSTMYSWGWNAFSQLGQQANSNKISFDENSSGLVPKKINYFDDKKIQMISCSKIHSCAISSDGNVYLWGLNVGQMGSAKQSHLNPHTNYSSQPGYIVAKPVVVNLQDLNIEQVICTEFATLIRSENNVLTVLTNYSIKTFKIPLPKSRHFKEIDPFNHFMKREIPNRVVDMKCSNKFGNNICFRYKCGRIGIMNLKNESPLIWSSLNSNILPVNLIWTPNFNFKKCLDFDVSFAGKLIICTIGGEVYKSSTSNNNDFEKIYSAKLLSGRPLKVSCDSTFGSFAVLKDENSNIPILYPRDNLINDFATYSPLVNSPNSDDSLVFGLASSLDFNQANFNMSIDPFTKSHFMNYYVDTAASKDNLNERGNFDIIFVADQSEEAICYCHKLLLESRCRKLINSLSTDKLFVTKDETFQWELISNINDPIWTIKVSSSKIISLKESMTEIVHFLYTDKKPTKQQTAILLVNIVDDGLHLMKLNDYLRELFSICLEYSNGKKLQYQNPDSLILLEDGEVYAHSVILSRRNAFFYGLFKNNWAKLNENGYFIVELKHITKSHFSCMLSHMYGMNFLQYLSDNLEEMNFFDCLQFLLDLIQYTDELLMTPFKTYLESLVSKYINGETVIPILLNSLNSKAELLMTSCNWFILTHFGILFTKENITIIDSHFDNDTWKRLEKQLYQLKKHVVNPAVTSTCAWYEIKNINWINIFKNNISGFNKMFVNPEEPFQPLFDLKLLNRPDTKTKPSGRRKSSVVEKANNVSINKDAITKSSGRRSSSYFSRPVLKNIWQNKNDESSGTEDADVFIEVGKNGRRKTVEDLKLPINALTKANQAKAEILLHTNENNSSELPSLLQSDKMNMKNSIEPFEEAQTPKIPGLFKKNNQKQRRKQLILDEKNEEKKDTKPVWGNNNSESPKIKKTIKYVYEKPTSSSSNTSISLPSLLDTTSSEIKSTQKKNRSKKKGQDKQKSSMQYTEFVSSGNPGGIRPYATSTKIEVNNIAAAFANPEAEISRTNAEDRMAELEFEKWFARESAKVQKKIKKNKNNLEAVYSSSQSIPDFTAPHDPNKKKKKIRAKFPSKHKTSNDNPEIKKLL